MKYVSTSDNHFFHRKTPIEFLTKNFIKTILIKDNEDIDILFIAGDLFDRANGIGSPEFLVVLEFIRVLLDYCADNNIKLRILEGTPSHDWWQSKIILRINQVREKKVDLKYFDSLDIEYMEDLNKHILYIPDEWATTHEEIEKQVDSKLLEYGISQVDIAIMHGFFQYQLVGIPFKGMAFKEDYFLPRVKGFVHFGHVHKHSHFDRIISNGSLDRLAHNEEEDKGYIRVDGDKWRFVVNPYAYTYKTIRITKRDTLNSLDSKIECLPLGSYVRLNMSKDHPFNLNFTELKLRYPDYHIQKKTEDLTDNNTVTNITSEEDIVSDGFNYITGNLRDTVRELILSKYSYSDSALQKLDKYLEPFKSSESKEEDILNG